MPLHGGMLTKEILFGMNILTLAGFIVMGLTLTLNRMGQAGKAVRIGLVGPQVRLWSSAGCMREAAYGDTSSRATPHTVQITADKCFNRNCKNPRST